MKDDDSPSPRDDHPSRDPRGFLDPRRITSVPPSRHACHRDTRQTRAGESIYACRTAIQAAHLSLNRELLAIEAVNGRAENTASLYERPL